MLTGLLVLAASISAQQQGPAAHYRITLHSSRNIERPSSGEDARGGTYTAVAYVSASTSTEGGARMGHVVIDSVICSGTGMLSMAFDTIVGRRSRGTRYDFPIGSRLEVMPVPTISNVLTNTLGQTALMLFPTIDPQAKAGMTWTDSLDTSPMGDPADRNHPVITRWKVAVASADSVVAEGEVRGALTSTGRVVGTGLIFGTRRMTAVSGMLRMQTSTVNQETQMVGEDATAIVRGTGSTTLEITRLP